MPQLNKLPTGEMDGAPPPCRPFQQKGWLLPVCRILM